MHEVADRVRVAVDEGRENRAVVLDTSAIDWIALASQEVEDIAEFEIMFFDAHRGILLHRLPKQLLLLLVGCSIHRLRLVVRGVLTLLLVPLRKLLASQTGQALLALENTHGG